MEESITKFLLESGSAGVVGVVTFLIMRFLVSNFSAEAKAEREFHAQVARDLTKGVNDSMAMVSSSVEVAAEQVQILGQSISRFDENNRELIREIREMRR